MKSFTSLGVTTPVEEKPSLFARLFGKKEQQVSAPTTPVQGRGQLRDAVDGGGVKPVGVDADVKGEGEDELPTPLPHAYNAEDREYWMPDHLVKTCSGCDSSFNALRRRHHCRVCGQIFCHSCSHNFLSRAFFGFSNGAELIRACDSCFKARIEQLQLHGEQRNSPKQLKERRTSVPTRPTSDGLISSTYKRVTIASLPQAVDFSSDSESEGELLTPKKLHRSLGLFEGYDDEDDTPKKPQTPSATDMVKEASGFDVPSYAMMRTKSVQAFHTYGEARRALLQPAVSMSDLFLTGHSKQQLRVLATRLLNTYELDVEKWCDVILKSTQHAVRHVQYRRHDKLDVRQYVKVKTADGGSLGEFEFLQGVAFYGSVAHKLMSAELRKPKVLLLSCPLEFKGGGTSKMLSFDVLLRQEKQYLSFLTERISALKPNVLITSDTVSNLALLMLLEANITVVSNVPLKVLERLSRFTGAEVVTTIAKLHSARLGSQAGSMTARFTAGSTPMLAFDVCPKYLGGTLVLKGGSRNSNLLRVKNICQFLLYATYHTRLECKLMGEIGIFNNATGDEPENSLSVSPFVTFPLAPTTNRRDRIPLVVENEPTTPHLLNTRCLNFNYEDVLECLNEARSAADSVNGRSRLEVLTGTQESPLTHQRIVYLYSTHNTEARTHCLQFQYHFIRYYSPNDLSLGHFLAAFCFDATAKCISPTCEHLRSEHEHTFLHDHSRMFVNVEQLASVEEDPETAAPADQVLVWSACNKCGERTDPQIMSNDSASLSFGKFLELAFCNRLLGCDQGHPLNPDGAIFFLRRNRVAKFDWSDAKTFSVSPPKLRLDLERSQAEESTAGPIESAVLLLSASASCMFDTIKQYLHATDEEATTLFEKLLQQSTNFNKSVEETQCCRLYEVNSLRQLLYDCYASWRDHFAPHNKELTKMILEALQKGSDPVLTKVIAGDAMFVRCDPLNAVLVMNDEQPSSAVAYCLGSALYKSQYNHAFFGDLKRSGNGSALIEVAERVLEQKKDKPIEVSFDMTLDDSRKAKIEVTSYYPCAFSCLRHEFCGGDVPFIQSLALSSQWASAGGASRAKFVRTADEKFILKSVQKVELNSFLQFSDSYFGYLFAAYKSQIPTMLVKILGVYSVEIKIGKKHAKEDYLVMENLFSNKNVDSVFDLKGSFLNRLKPETSPVLLDENFRRLLYSIPHLVDEIGKLAMGLSVWNDAFFLASIHVMDYSMLLGIDETKGELVLGIIDYIRPYTWDKYFESWVKSTPGIISGTGKKPTVISPDLYKVRFREALWQYFPMLPDTWTQVMYAEDHSKVEARHIRPKILVGYEEDVEPDTSNR